MLSGLRSRLVNGISHPLVVGAEVLPASGPVVLAANHPTRFDDTLIKAAVPRAAVVTALLSDAETDAAARALAAGQVVVVFVEGARSPDGALHRGTVGLARLLRRAGDGVPVLPLAVSAPDERRGWLAASGAAGPSVRIGEPIDVQRHVEAGLSGIAEETADRALTDAVTSALLQLSGQPYVDQDAATRTEHLRREAVAERQRRSELSRQERERAEQARAEAQRRAEEEARQAAEDQEWAEKAARDHARRAALQDEMQRAARRAGTGETS